jgi:hypothetical protein
MRFLGVTVRMPLVTDAGVALLGHELRHAAEVAAAPWVTDERLYGILYERIGHAQCSRPQRCFDTVAAVDAGRQVLRELRSVTRVAAHVGHVE